MLLSSFCSIVVLFAIVRFFLLVLIILALLKYRSVSSSFDINPFLDSDVLDPQIPRFLVTGADSRIPELSQMQIGRNKEKDEKQRGT